MLELYDIWDDVWIQTKSEDHTIKKKFINLHVQWGKLKKNISKKIDVHKQIIKNSKVFKDLFDISLQIAFGMIRNEEGKISH